MADARPYGAPAARDGAERPLARIRGCVPGRWGRCPGRRCPGEAIAPPQRDWGLRRVDARPP